MVRSFRSLDKVVVRGYRFLGLVRDVAQPGSAPAWGVGGRRFKSGRPDHFVFLEIYKNQALAWGEVCHEGDNPCVPD